MADDSTSSAEQGAAETVAGVLYDHAWNGHTGRCRCGWYVPNDLRGEAIDWAHADHQAAALHPSPKIEARAMDVLPDGRVDHRDHDRDDDNTSFGWLCLWCSTEDGPDVAWTIPHDIDGRPLPEDWREMPYREVLALCGMSTPPGVTGD